jgi:hypothetical protein
MRIRLWFLTLGLLGAITGADVTAAHAQASVPSAGVQSPGAQFYVLSFTDAPIGEVAEAVVGGALSRDISIDPAIDGTMSFSAEGAFTPEALLQEFGTAALDLDIALIQSRAGALSLVPRSNMASELAKGSSLVALAPPVPGSPARAAATATPPIVYGSARWWDGPVAGLLLFLTGAVSGAGALFVGQRLLRPMEPRPSPAMIRITHTAPAPDGSARGEGLEDLELTIPRFETSPRDGQGSRL